MNFMDEYGSTALLRAVNYGNEMLVSLLLDHGADIDAKDSLGWTALSRAVVNGNVKMVQLLVHRGANVNIKNGNGRSALAVTLSALVAGQFITTRQSEPDHEVFGPDRYFQIVRLLFENGAYSEENPAGKSSYSARGCR